MNKREKEKKKKENKKWKKMMAPALALVFSPRIRLFGSLTEQTY